MLALQKQTLVYMCVHSSCKSWNAAVQGGVSIKLPLRCLLQVAETHAMFERGAPPTLQTDRYQLALQGWVRLLRQ